MRFDEVLYKHFECDFNVCCVLVPFFDHLKNKFKKERS